MRGLGRLIGKAAAGAAPVALEKWRNDVLAKRDAVLRQYQVQDRDVQIANSNEQARLNREQDTDQFNQQMQQRQTEFGASHALEERRTTAAERAAAAEEGRAGKLMEQLDIAIQSDQLALEDRQALQKLYTELEAAETPEEQDTLLNRIFARQGKERDPEFKFIEGSTIDEATGERISTLFRTNARTGEVEFIGPGGELGGGLTVPQAAIDELLKDPSPEAIAEFNEVFGAGAADQYTRQQGGGERTRIQDTDTAAPAAAPPTVPRGGLLNLGVPGIDPPAPNQRLPPGDGVRRRDAGTPLLQQQQDAAPADDILAGFKIDKEPGAGERIVRAVSDYRQRERAQNQASRRKYIQDTAVAPIKKDIQSKDLTAFSTYLADGRLESALESGLLSADEIAIVNAWLDQQE